MPNKIGIIVEGGKREVGYWDSINKCFFPKTEILFLPLPAEKNLYMLWKQLIEDEFETDVIEIVRECGMKARTALDGLTRDDFQEIYLFFDFDPHQQNLSKGDKTAEEILHEMITVFDNETENGKLYISYPMCEAVRDVNNISCIPANKCEISKGDVSAYKTVTGGGNPFAAYKRYDRATWEMFIAIFLHRCRCLHNCPIEDEKLIEWYKREVSPKSILQNELIRLKQEKVFVLSAFPEFLIDYYRADNFPYLSEVVTTITDCGKRMIGIY